MRIAIASSCLLALALSGCMKPAPACMSPKESGTVETYNRIPYADTCHEMACRNHPHPDYDTLVVGFRMNDGSLRTCTGQWYPESSVLDIGRKATVIRLKRGEL